MASTEDSFPRGGFKPSATADPSVKKPQKQENLFGNVQAVKKAKGKKKRHEKQDDGETTSVPDFINKTEALTAVSADSLSVKKIHEGMSVLAFIKEHKVVTVNVELPGRCFGEILVQNISSGYTKQVSEAVNADGTDVPTLENVLPVGTFIPVKVLKIDNVNKLRIFVTCNPVEINQHYKHADFTKHMLVWGAIKEKSDHGYLIDMGVKSCRAHLPFDAIDDEKEYSVGKVMYMVVMKSVSSKEATTLTLSATKTAFEKTVESMGTSLDKVLPGMQVEFLVQKVLKDGLQGQYFDECTGFINDLYLQKAFDSTKRYKEFTAIKARLLYVHPVSKLGYFTLKPLDEPMPEDKLSVGSWLAGTVAGKAGAGLVVKLQGGRKGIVTHKRLMQSINIKDKDQEDLVAMIANKFPPGSTRHCTILDYNHTERLYICTFEHITEFMNINQLQIAQTVKGTITEINDHGLVIQVGKLQGFAPKDNLANVAYSENIKRQFNVGQEVTAKIWNKGDGKDLILTLKPDLLSSNNHLDSYDELSTSEQYPGVIIALSSTGALLLFYGGIKGWLPSRNIPQLGNKHTRDEFYKGQIVKVRVENCLNERLTLTLNLPSKKRVRVGKIVSKPKISSINENGLYVLVGNTDAYVPNAQLAVGGLGKLLVRTYKVDEVFDEELMCVMDGNPSILSVRENVVHKREDLKIPALSELTVNTVMRGIYNNKNMLCVPLKSHLEGFKVDHKYLKNVERYESLCARVKKVDGEKISWSLQLGRVFSFSYLETLQYLDQYLQDIERLRSRYLHTGNALVDLEIGATVDCVVNRIDPKRGCTVSVLPMKCQGLVALKDCPDDLKARNKVKGKILWVNYELKYAAVALHPEVMEKIGGKDDDIDLEHQKSTALVEVLHANNKVAVGVLGEEYKKQLVYMPVKMHENDFTPKIDYYDSMIGTKVKVRLTKMPSGRLLGVTINMKKTMKSNREKCNDDEMIILRNEEIKEPKQKQDKNDDSDEDVEPSKKEKVKKKKEKKQKKEVEIKEEDEGIASSEDIKSEMESVDDNSEDSNEITPMEVVEEVVETIKLTKKQKRKLEEEQTSPKKKKKTKLVEEEPTKLKTEVILPGMSSFFEEEAPLVPKEESDDEDTTVQQNKKPTPAERLQKAKDEEARLRKIETELADASLLPQNAEQFDRALLGNPDDSELWTRYIAFHAQSTEFEKARSVCKRAIERISFTALQDRLNVWLAYLNLENMYGTKDSFRSVFENAARCNDTMTIHLETIKMMAEMSKFTEMEELVKKARRKFKQELQMWLEIAKVYYKCGKFSEARKLKENALITLTDKKSHIQLIVQFAIMEFVHGESNQGEALFETILQADPKKVDIWCTYVDQLIKKKEIDLARNVLSRAVGQKLAYKKMRTLFKKYHAFETTYGDEETLAHVTNLLREYSDQ